jgi:hypothetical protein
MHKINITQGIWGFVVAITLLVVKVIIKPSSGSVVIGIAAADIITALFFIAGYDICHFSNHVVLISPSFIAASTMEGLDCSKYRSPTPTELLTACRCVDSGIAMGAVSWYVPHSCSPSYSLAIPLLLLSPHSSRSSLSPPRFSPYFLITSSLSLLLCLFLYLGCVGQFLQ